MAGMILANQQPENDTVELGQFNGVPIHARQSDQYVNATAMCKAAGKEWSNYWKNQQTQDFVDALSSHLLIRSCDLTQSIKGYGTWVHRRVALDLARWCSPEFAVKVNGWIDQLLTTGKVAVHREHSEAILERCLGQVGQAIALLTSESVATKTELREFRHEVRNELTQIRSEMEQSRPRRNATTESVKRHEATVVACGGMCPKCLMKKIIHEGQFIPGAVEIDHFFSSSRNGVDEVWPLCKSCHLEFTVNATTFRKENDSAFYAHQQRREQVEHRMGYIPIGKRPKSKSTGVSKPKRIRQRRSCEGQKALLC